jgi:hypothetical protein
MTGPHFSPGGGNTAYYIEESDMSPARKKTVCFQRVPVPAGQQCMVRILIEKVGMTNSVATV